MLPPFFRRCPNCGYVGAAGRFGTATEEGVRLVECPRCAHRFEPLERPWLA